MLSVRPPRTSSLSFFTILFPILIFILCFRYLGDKGLLVLLYI